MELCPGHTIFSGEGNPCATLGVPCSQKYLRVAREGPMPDVSEKIVENLRFLRRYARALLGSQQTGDTYVRICLEALLQEPDRISANNDVRLQLFRLFHDVWQRAGSHDDDEGENDPRDLSVEA